MLLADRCRTEDHSIGGDLAPTEDTKAEGVRDLCEDIHVLFTEFLILGGEEDVADGILSGLGEQTVDVALCLALEELVVDAGHDTGAVAVATVCACRAAMGHVAEELAGIGDDLVARGAFDMADEADAARVALVLIVIEALGGGEGAAPGLRIALDLVEAAGFGTFGLFGDKG